MPSAGSSTVAPLVPASPTLSRRRLVAIAAVAALATAGAAVLFVLAARSHSGESATWHTARRNDAVAAAGSTAPAAALPSASPSPEPQASTALPAAFTIPGDHPQLPWPGTGQSAVEVEGVGSLGSAGSHTPVPIASITKVMTAYLVLRDHPLSATAGGPTITVTAAEAAAYAQEKAANESLVPVTAGEQLTERQALIALLLPSADNIARILARWDAGSVSAFIAEMNATAASLGLHDTHYTDPSGYAASTVSTAADQISLAEQAMRQPALRTIVAMSTGTVPVAGLVHNYNTLLGRDGVIGIKTGSTTAAGGCLLFAATRTVDGHPVTIVGAVLGQPGSIMHGLPEALTASDQLVRAAAAALHPYPLIQAGQHVTPTLVATRAATVLGWPGLTYQASLHGNTLRLTARTTTVTVPLTQR